MRLIDKLISDKLKWQIEQEKAQIQREALDNGFEMGQKSMQERLLDTGILGTKEDTHTIKCMNCAMTIKLPCTNFAYKQTLDYAPNQPTKANKENDK